MVRMEIAIGAAAAVLLGVIGFVVGRSSGAQGGESVGRDRTRAELQTAIDAVRRGELPQTGSLIAVDLRQALEEGWAPRQSERQAALVEAMSRVSAFLKQNVKAPLAGASERASATELHERIDRALGALGDLDFYLEEPSTEREGHDLVTLIQQLAREFAADHAVGLRLSLASGSIRATVNRQVLLDSLYLILHNAARFGEGETVDVALETVDGRCVIRVRDRGEGFSEEAFKRAFDPFYSTSSEGLGLGLPHARSLIEGMGGRIELSNVPDGGAQVEVSFPAV